MNMKALLKAILVVLAIVTYIIAIYFVVRTENPVLIGVFISPIIGISVTIIGHEVYEYFKEDRL